MTQMSALKRGKRLQRKMPTSHGSGIKNLAADAGLLQLEQRLIKCAKTAKPRRNCEFVPKWTPIASQCE